MNSTTFNCPVAVLLVLLAGSATLGQPPAPPKDSPPRISQGSLKEGDLAPDFSLKDVDGKNAIKLSDLKGKPVVLIFGSCTCPPFVGTAKTTQSLRETYKDKVHFYIVYIREAHPTDGWSIPNNQFQVKSPRSLDERQAIAKKFAEKLEVSMPILVDSIDDEVSKSYSCWPNRMCIIGADGKIVDKGTAGPNGVATSARRAAEVLDSLLEKAK